MAGRPEELQGDAQWRSAGDRIQTLLDATAAGGVGARERAEQLVREVVELYGAGLSRVIAMVDDPAFVDRLVADDLVASLLLVHGLHPHNVRQRVSDALDRVRPYLGSHGGDVHLLDIVDDTVQLQFAGSCKSCPSSAVTLELAVEDAVRAAAPEICSIEVVAADSASKPIPAESLLTHVRSNGHGPSTWCAAPELAALAPGEVGGFVIGDTTVLACRVDDQTFAYRDHCPVCDDSLAGAVLDAALLRCPRCHKPFDVVHAGTGPGGTHLDPLPLLVREGVLSVALQATGVPA